MRARGPTELPAGVVFEVCCLVTVLLVTAVVVSPAHWTSIWMDREFTGWVAPIANRLANGQRLYVDGSHIPMPPLPFVLVDVVSGGRATWLLESRLNVFFQALTVLVLYAGLSRHFARPIPFLAALATIPIFFSLPKTIVYDSLAQTFVALVAVAAAEEAVGSGSIDERRDASNRGSPSVRGLVRMLCLGTATAAVLLTKQSTGAGVALGVGCLLLFFQRARRVRTRIARTAMYVVTTAAAGVAMVLALSPLLSMRGLLIDVFATSGEPKGGTALIAKNLASYAAELVMQLIPAAALLLLGYGTLRLAGRALQRDTAAALPIAGGVSPGDHQTALGAVVLSAAGLLGGAAALLSIARLRPDSVDWQLPPVPGNLLAIGLLLALVVVGLAIAGAGANSRETTALAALTVVTFAAAVFHSLSVPTFRWCYDNNPLITVVLVALFVVTLQALQRSFGRRRLVHIAVTAAVVCFVQFAMWTVPAPQVEAIRRCVTPWPEVPYLAGARMRRTAEGMRRLVQLVQTMAPDRNDTVLLLPDDPNVESWFERPRPQLSGAVVFVDQYWDRYVDVDFQRLATQPPRVIVIGPRGFWRASMSFWNGAERGAGRLITRIINELLPTQYHWVAAQPITFQHGSDFMDLYVRNDPSL